MITDVAGRDATKEFDDFGHSSDAKQILKKYIIGELVEVRKKTPTLSCFTVRKIVNFIFADG